MQLNKTKMPNKYKIKSNYCSATLHYYNFFRNCISLSMILGREESLIMENLFNLENNLMFKLKRTKESSLDCCCPIKYKARATSL